MISMPKACSAIAISSRVVSSLVCYYCQGIHIKDSNLMFIQRGEVVVSEEDTHLFLLDGSRQLGEAMVRQL